MSIHTDDGKLNTCGCCEGIAPRAFRDNRPGQPAIAYRLDTHAGFLRWMKARLSLQQIPDGANAGERPLRDLTTRSTDDPAIATLDAWAVVADVLTFYQERIANEGFLRTATERRSVLELARAIGYELKPGVAASAYLAFTVEEAQGAPKVVEVPTGTKVQSIPAPGKLLQTFETIEAIQARVEWNTLKPRTTELKTPEFGNQEVYLKGAATGLKTGDGLLFVGEEWQQDPGGERWDFRRVKTVTPDYTAEVTKVTWDEGLGWKRGSRKIQPAQKNPRVYAFRQRAALFGYNAPDWRIMADSVKAGYLTLGLYAEFFDNINLTNRKVTRIDPQVNFDWGTGSPDPAIAADTFSARWTGFVKPTSSGTYTFHTWSDDGVRLWVNGQLIINNWTDHAPKEDRGTITLAAGQMYDIRLEYYENGIGATIKLSWSGPNQPKEVIPQSQLYPPDIHLDAVYSQILPGSWLVLSSPDYQELYQVEAATEDSRSNFTLNVKTTRVTLKGENLNLFDNKLRETVVFAQSEQLELAEQPLTTFVEGNEISLDRWVQGLESGQTLIVSGKRMRARVADTVDKLKLVCDDGSETVELKAGDVLFVMKSPSSEPGGRNKWHLMERNGFVGFVTTPNRRKLSYSQRWKTTKRSARQHPSKWCLRTKDAQRLV